MQAHRSDIHVRFNDTDALGHLNNTSFSVYAEYARLEFFTHVSDTILGSLILAHIALDFRRQVRFGEPVHVLTRVAKLGNSSVHLQQDIYARDELAAEVYSVIVIFDYQAQKPTAIPDDLRQAMQAYMLEEA